MSQTSTPLNRPIEQSTTKGFFSLPLELRNYIYYLILQPAKRSWTSRIHFLRCAKILSLCSQAYTEARPFLHPFVVWYVLGKDRNRTLPRDPKANGKPNIYESRTRTSACYTHQRCSELELVRMTNIQLACFEPHWHDDFEARIAKMNTDLRMMVEVTRKSTDLSKLFLVLGNWEAHSSLAYTSFLTSMLDLLQACKEKNVQVFIKHYRDYDDHDEDEEDSEDAEDEVSTHPMATYILAAATALDLNIETIELSRDDDDYRCHEPIVHQVIKYQNEELRTLRKNTIKNKGVGNDWMYRDPNYYIPQASSYKDYVPIPECRKCLAVFATNEELRKHLEQKPEHATSFTKKHWNPVSKLAGRRRGRVCWTCGYECAALDTLNTHLDKNKHRRHGIVPRYKEDNWAWDRRWKAHKKKYGWL